MVGVLIGNRWKNEILAEGVDICFERTVEMFSIWIAVLEHVLPDGYCFSYIIRDCKMNSGSFKNNFAVYWQSDK